uniref:C2H2-type domain-containing protein n=1 Tax=Panagrellus redivivus TaxID=6233 RepID=A0A7E4VV93_PANRE
MLRHALREMSVFVPHFSISITQIQAVSTSQTNSNRIISLTAIHLTSQSSAIWPCPLTESWQGASFKASWPFLKCRVAQCFEWLLVGGNLQLFGPVAVPKMTEMTGVKNPTNGCDGMGLAALGTGPFFVTFDTPNGSPPPSLRSAIPEDDDELTSLVDMTDASLRLKCHQCSDFYTAPLSDLETPTEDPATSSSPAATPESDPETANPRCPLCDEPKPATALESHLLLDHRIAADVAKKLMLAGPSSGTVAVSRVKNAGKPCDHQNGTHPPASAYSYHCQACPMVFRTEEGFQKHTLKHVFDAAHKCTRCNRTFKSMFSLRHHLTNKHGLTAPTTGSNELRCSICEQEYPDRVALQAHVYSLDHLHRAKKFLEEQNSGKFGQQLSDQILSMLALVPNQQKPQSTSPTTSTAFDAKKPYKCNVCYLSYSQGSSLDIHLRSVAHQTRIGRLAELLATGEVEAHLPVSEQPGGIPQKTIGDLVLPATNTEIEKMRRGCVTPEEDHLHACRWGWWDEKKREAISQLIGALIYGNESKCCPRSTWGFYQ